MESQFNEICEGKAKIRVPATSNVFYNPVQEFNRDLSIAVLSVFSGTYHSEKQKYRKRQRLPDKNNITEAEPVKLEVGIQIESGLEILEALSATGLRAIRYALEVPGVKQIYANDISKMAVDIINQNIEGNNVQNLVTATHYDAAHVMRKRQFESEKMFDVVDLDPFGCPTNLLDPAVCCLADNGLLLVTCTDMAVLCGNTPESCYAKYGSVCVRSPSCHEMALRIVLHTITNVCTRYRRYMEPLLSISADFYIRVFVIIRTSPYICKTMSSKISTVYKCRGCNMITLMPLGSIISDNQVKRFNLLSGPPVDKKCEHCGFSHLVAGPIWTDPLYNIEFLGKLDDYLKTEEAEKKFSTIKRMRGMIGMMQAELQDIPLYYTLPSLTNVVHCEAMPLKTFYSGLMGSGYRVSLSHCAPNSVKTDAPQSVIWDIIRTWVQTHPVNAHRLKVSDAARIVLSKQITTKIIFDKNVSIVPNSLRGLVRYQKNPTSCWGPGTKGKSRIVKKNFVISNADKNVEVKDKEFKGNEVKEAKVEEKSVKEKKVMNEDIRETDVKKQRLNCD